MKAKVIHDEDTRVWRYSSTEDFEGLVSFIRSNWNHSDFIAQYEDDEGDLITIASAVDLKDAFESAMDQNKKSLKIYVHEIITKGKKSASVGTETEVEQKPIVSQITKGCAEQEPEPEPHFNSVREMVIDFLGNPQIQTVLPQFFVSLVSKLKQTGHHLTESQIVELIHSQILSTKDMALDCVLQHALYCQYHEIAVPYIAAQLCEKQSILPLFGANTLKNWIKQIMTLLLNALRSSPVSLPLKNIVLDIEYPDKTDDGRVIHFGVECDVCEQYPIIGDRFKCTICSDFDLCESCEAKADHKQHSNHSADHPMIKFKNSSKKLKNVQLKGLDEVIKQRSNIREDQKSNENDNEEQEEEDALQCVCICGATLKAMSSHKAYGYRTRVFCDSCGAICSGKVYHCPESKKAALHRSGYDLCQGCALMTSQRQQIEQNEQKILLQTIVEHEKAMKDKEMEFKKKQKEIKKAEKEAKKAEKEAKRAEKEAKKAEKEAKKAEKLQQKEEKRQRKEAKRIEKEMRKKEKEEKKAEKKLKKEMEKEKEPEPEPEPENEGQEFEMVESEENDSNDDSNENESQSEQKDYSEQIDAIKQIMAFSDDSMDDLVRDTLVANNGDIQQCLAQLMQF